MYMHMSIRYHLHIIYYIQYIFTYINIYIHITAGNIEKLPNLLENCYEIIFHFVFGFTEMKICHIHTHV